MNITVRKLQAYLDQFGVLLEDDLRVTGLTMKAAKKAGLKLDGPTLQILDWYDVTSEKP